MTQIKIPDKIITKNTQYDDRMYLLGGGDMKLILAIISTDDTKACISALNKASFHVTRLATTGGFLSSGNTTLIIGCEDKEVEKAIEIIGNESQRRKEAVPSTISSDMSNLVSYPIEVEVGGATIFVLNVDDFRKL